MSEKFISEATSVPLMHIVCCSDQHYLPHLSVTLRSLLAHHQPFEFDVFLVLNNCTDAQLDIFLKAILPIQPHIIRDAKIAEMPFFIDRHISVTTYQRIYLDNLLPEEVDKFIYLDCDTVVTGSLSALWNLDMEQNIIAAAPEFNATKFSETGDPYCNSFNAGVLLVNRKSWHQQNITEKLELYIIENGENLKAWDQDALNSILKDAWKRIHNEWNLSSKFFTNKKQLTQLGLSAIFLHPKIVHFSASIKPWHYRLRHPYKHLYLAYLHPVYKQRFKYPDKNGKTMLRKHFALLLKALRLKDY